jgi:hypothetical protein
MVISDAADNLYLQAEQYTLGEASRRYRPHPDGLPPLAGNILLLGYPGAGKTLTMLKMCHDLRSRSDVLPLYLPIEPWLATAASETSFPLHRRSTPREADVVTTSRALLALGLVDLINSYGSEELLDAAVRQFPGTAGMSDLATWQQEQLDLCRSVLDYGRRLPASHAEFPSLYGFVDQVGRTARRSGTKLVLLFDQVERTSSLYFDAVSGVLRRGEYLAIVASRPCPTAPARSLTPPGGDYRIHWLGTSSRSSKWRDFVMTLVSPDDFGPQVIELVNTHLTSLTSLLGPSARNVLAFALYVQGQLERGAPIERAWGSAITTLLDAEESSAAGAIGAWCGSPLSIFRDLRNRALDSQPSGIPGPSPAIAHLVGSELIPPDEVQNFIRLCTREGVLIPTQHQRHGLDELLEEYEINPLIISPRDPEALRDFSSTPTTFDLELDDVERWAKSSYGHRKASPAQRIFVSYWMTQGDESLPDLLEPRLLNRAELLTGAIQGSPQYSPEIRRKVKTEADLVIVDLSALRREVLVEYGWAIGSKKRIFLAARNEDARAACPEWLRERQIHLFESARIDEFVKQLVDTLDTPADTVATWDIDPTGHSLNRRPDQNTTAVIGAGPNLAGVLDLFSAVNKEFGLGNIHSIDLSTGARVGGELFEVIRLCRQASRLVLVFSGQESVDFLLCAAGGIFTTYDSYSNKKIRKHLLNINLSGAATSKIVPSLLSTKPGVATSDDLSTGSSRFREWLESR